MQKKTVYNESYGQLFWENCYVLPLLYSRRHLSNGISTPLPFVFRGHPCRLFFAAAAVAAPFILISNSAYAALNCTTQPTCEQLGYSKSVDSNCDDYILCPFDTSYKKCITGKVDCAELGFTQDDKSEWCNKIVTCQTDSSYTLCAATEASARMYFIK